MNTLKFTGWMLTAESLTRPGKSRFGGGVQKASSTSGPIAAGVRVCFSQTLKRRSMNFVLG